MPEQDIIYIFDNAGDFLNAGPAFKKAEDRKFVIRTDPQIFELLSNVCDNIELIDPDESGLEIRVSALLWTHPEFNKSPLHVVIGRVLGVDVDIEDQIFYMVEDEDFDPWQFSKGEKIKETLGLHLKAKDELRSVPMVERTKLFKHFHQRGFEVHSFDALEDSRNITLRQNIALFSTMSKAICVDSFYNHIAYIFGIPTISIFTLVDPGLRSHGHIFTIEKLHCMPCNGYIKCSQRYCCEKITANAIIERYEWLFDRKPIYIIIPVRNQLKMTIDCIGKILRYSYMPVQIIVVDNASTEPVINNIHNNFGDKVYVVRQGKNTGWIGGINAGTSHHFLESDSDIVLWMNNDVMVTNDWLPRLVRALEDTEADAVGPKSDYVMWLQKSFQVNPQKGEYGYNWRADRLWKGHWKHYIETKLLIGFCLMLKRSTIEKVGLLDDKTFGLGMSDDLDYCIRMGKEGLKLTVAENCFVHHVGNVSFKEAREKEGYTDYEKDLKAKDALLRKKWSDEVVDDLFKVKPELSVCIIAYNEARSLPVALAPFIKTDFVKEIIIGVDTKSTDKTKSVAKKLRKTRVFDLKFMNFAQARNETLRRAKSDWVIWMDADDHFSLEALQNIRNLMNMQGMVAFTMATALIDKGEVVNQNSRVRMIRNGRGYHFEHYVHENLTLRGDEFAITGVTINHGVIRPAHEHMLQFEVELLREEIVNDPTNVMTRLNYARALEAAKHYSEAEREYNGILQRQVNDYGETTYMCHLQLGHISQSQGNLVQGLNYAHQAMRCAILRAEPWSLAGICYMDMKLYKQAEACFKAALGCRIQWHHTMPIDPGLYSWKSLSNLGAVLLLQGRFPEAERVLEDAKAYSPDNPEININLDLAKNKAQQLRSVTGQLTQDIRKATLS